MCKSFFASLEMSVCAFVSFVPELVQLFVYLIEVWNHVFEFRCGEEEELACGAADFIEHVCDEKEE